jgi:hypothetical protein
MATGFAPSAAEIMLSSHGLSRDEDHTPDGNIRNL